MKEFYKNLLKNPKSVGSVIPSTPILANAMATEVFSQPQQLVVELGPGTGVVTQALIKRSEHPEQIIGVEYHQSFVNKLKLRFPKVKLIHGDAMHLKQLLENCSSPITTIVSCLPVTLFTDTQWQKLINEIYTVLAPGGRFVQYSYFGLEKYKTYFAKFSKPKITRVWLNMPPAKIYVYKKI